MGEGGKAIKPPGRETDRKPGATNANLTKQKPGGEERAGRAQMQEEDAGICRTAGLLRTSSLTFTGQAVRIYARSHFVLLAQNSESSYVSAASPAGNLACRSA